jgi:hypothetical protein
LCHLSFGDSEYPTSATKVVMLSLQTDAAISGIM